MGLPRSLCVNTEQRQGSPRKCCPNVSFMAPSVTVGEVSVFLLSLPMRLLERKRDGQGRGGERKNPHLSTVYKQTRNPETSQISVLIETYTDIPHLFFLNHLHPKYSPTQGFNPRELTQEFWADQSALAHIHL